MGKKEETWIKNKRGKVEKVIVRDEKTKDGAIYKAIDNTDNPLIALLCGPVKKGSKIGEIKRKK